MAKYAIDSATLTGIADAIRSKKGSTEQIQADQMAAEIEGISGAAEPNLQEKTVVPSTSDQTFTPDDGYDGFSSVTVEGMHTVEMASPTITLNSMGWVTAKYTQEEDGYVFAGQKGAMMELPTQPEQTIIPGTTDQIIAYRQYLTGPQTIKGDANLLPENIRYDKTLFGVKGSYRGESSSGSSDCNCDDISVENGTCTVEVIADGEMHFSGAEMTCVEWDDDSTANLVEWFHEEWAEADWGFEYENVVCGSYFLLHATKNGFDSYEAENAKLLCHFLWGEYKLFRITAPPGGKATIRMIGTE